MYERNPAEAAVNTLAELTLIVQLSESRRESLDAVRRILDCFPDHARPALESILKDPLVSLRSKAFVIYYLREFGHLEELVNIYGMPLRTLVDAIVRDEDSEGDE